MYYIVDAHKGKNKIKIDITDGKVYYGTGEAADQKLIVKRGLFFAKEIVTGYKIPIEKHKLTNPHSKYYISEGMFCDKKTRSRTIKNEKT